MSRETEDACRQRRGVGSKIGVLLLLLGLIPSCQDLQHLNLAPVTVPSDPKPGVQEGEVTLRDGDETKVAFVLPYQTPPRVTIVEVKRAESYAKPFARSDFEIVEVDAISFKIRNNHPERGVGSWATIKWRAQGTPAVIKAAAGATPVTPKSKTAQEQMVERFRKLGGRVDLDSPLPGGLIVNVDLHGTSVADADLELLQGVGSIRSLNLYGTQIGDAGLMHLSGLTGLRVLYLNDTRTTDAGLQHLQGLTHLNELALDQTRVTDAGLPALQGMTDLHDLTLGGGRITDAGLVHLERLRGLRHLTLVHTSVTRTGVERIRKALPDLKVIQ